MNPWQTLTHDNILESLETVLKKKLSNLLLQRNSYINRVYELEEYDSKERLIVKFYRPNRWTKEQLLEEHGFLQALAAQEIPVVPPLSIDNNTIFQLENIYFAIFPKRGGRALDEFNKESWEEIGRLLARVHMIGQSHTSSQRLTWRPAEATRQHLQTILASTFLLTEFAPAFKSTAETFINKADPKFQSQEFILLHGDCHKSNLIHRPGEGIYIVDFDDMSFGPAAQDLWLLLPGAPEDCPNEVSWLLKGYEVFRSFDRASLELVPLLRAMRIIHYVAWLAVQSEDPDFAKHFPHAGTRQYWNEIIKELQAINDII